MYSNKNVFILPMDNFIIYLQYSPIIEKEHLSPYLKDMKSTKCPYFVSGKITIYGELESLFIGQTYDAKHLIECFKNKPRFLKEVYFTVINWHYDKEVITKFKGNFIDALEFIDKYGEFYIMGEYLSPTHHVSLDAKFINKL